MSEPKNIEELEALLEDYNITSRIDDLEEDINYCNISCNNIIYALQLYHEKHGKEAFIEFIKNQQEFEHIIKLANIFEIIKKKNEGKRHPSLLR